MKIYLACTDCWKSIDRIPYFCSECNSMVCKECYILNGKRCKVCKKLDEENAARNN